MGVGTEQHHPQKSRPIHLACRHHASLGNRYHRPRSRPKPGWLNSHAPTARPLRSWFLPRLRVSYLYVSASHSNKLTSHLLTSLHRYYKRYELQWRLNLFFCGAILAGAFSGLLAYALAKLDGLGGYEGWRWIFIMFVGSTVLPCDSTAC